MNLSPLPIQKFFNNNGEPLVGGLLYTYTAGTTTKVATYTDSTGGSTNINPIVLDYRGECRVWLDVTKTYKFILSPAGDTDPPTKAIWTVDNIAAPISFADLTQQIVGFILYPRTAAEIAATVTPTNYSYPPGDVRRYGATCDGSTDDTSAINSGASVVRAALIAIAGAPNVLSFPIGGTCKVSSTLDFSGITVDGGGFNLSGVPHIKATSAQFDVIKSTGRTTIRNLFVDGGWDQVTAGLSGDTLSFINPSTGAAYDIYVENLALIKNKKRGIYWEGGAYGCIHRPQISGCGLHAVELFSVDVAHTTTTIGISGKGSMSSTPNGYALKITACVAISVDNMIMEATKGILVAGSGNRTLSFDRIYQESPAAGAKFLDLGASDGIGLSVTNCFGTAAGLIITEPSGWNNVHYDSNALNAESSIYAAGRYVISDGGEVTTATTGGTNFTAGTLALAPGTWLINSTMQVQDAGGAAIVRAGIQITGNVADSGLNINTNVNFTEGCDECNSFGASKDGRLHAWRLYQNSTGATVNIYLRGFINISAGTIAYRGYSTAVKMQ